MISEGQGLNLGGMFSRGDVHRAYGIVETNAIQSKTSPSQHGQQKSQPYRCIFPTMALLSNSCHCNARCIRYGEHGTFYIYFVYVPSVDRFISQWTDY